MTAAALGWATLTVAYAAACAPRARPLAGTPAPTSLRLPGLGLANTRERVVFRWRYEEPGFSARGDGAARVAPPDSARLDFFLEGGFGSGWAALVGDDLRTPQDDVARRLVPPAPLLWAAFGRLAVPSSTDTTLRVTGDTLRADLGSPGSTRWRATVVGGTLVGLERVQSGRVVERLSRDGSAVHYDDVVGRRTLAIYVQRRDTTGPFPATIWSH